MPTFPEDPTDQPQYNRPWRNPAPRPNPAPAVRCTNFVPLPRFESVRVAQMIKFVTDQMNWRAPHD